MSWDALGGDPVPGDPDAVRLTARLLAEVEQVAAAVGRQLRSVGDPHGIWSGEAADAFGERLTDLLPDLDKLARSHGVARDALASYAAVLEQAQAMARAAAGPAAAAQADLDAANRSAREADDEAAARGNDVRAALVQAGRARAAAVLGAFDPMQQAACQHDAQLADTRRRHAAEQAELAAQRGQLARANAAAAAARLEAARRLAADARQLRESAGRTAADRLHEASDAGIRNRTLVQKAFDDAMDGSRYLFSWDGFRNWLAVIGDIGDLLTTVGGLLCLVFPEAGALLVAVGAGLLAVAFVGTILAWACSHANKWDVARAGWSFAWAAVPGVKALKVVTEGAHTEATLVEMGGLLKRAFAPLDNRTLSGLPRKLLWTTVSAAPALTQKQLGRLPVRILGPNGYFAGKLALEGGEKVHEALETPDAAEHLVADLTDYHVPSEEESRAEFIKDLTFGIVGK